LTKPPTEPQEVLVTVHRAMEKKRLKDANARLLREMEGLSRTDALTGVWTRRAFEETLRRELVRAARHELPLSLVLVDVDHFKRINDTYGHRAGDEVLKWFGGQAGRLLREGDTLSRYGGEEFAVILPQTGATGAMTVANRLLESLAETVFDSGVCVTASAGVASGFGQELEEIDLVALADSALYRAKHDGRNRASSEGRSIETSPTSPRLSPVPSRIDPDASAPVVFPHAFRSA
jgi:diguanylate cyclase (GGDEF)-like protein